MSTAGKVLVVLIMLTGIGCLILAGGVAQLNANANQKLAQLSAEAEKTQAEIESTKKKTAEDRDQTSETQERIDRDVAALQSRVTDLERTQSQIRNTLYRLQYDLSMVNGTIAGARESLQTRIAEFDADTKAMADLRRDVQSLRENNSQLMARLQSLRGQFQDTYHKNLQMIERR